jgi:acyl phosphate:glycerol-3-phosphate acyltransferase
MSPLAWIILPAAYLLGGISPGYWLVRWRTGADLREQGSGATGATNAARLLGRQGFIAVMVLDALKGAVAAAAARWVGLSDGWEFAAAVAVIAGHIWPIQLGFRGGRGLSPLLGAWLVLAPLAIGVCLAFAAVIWGTTRRRIVGGLLGALLLPVTTWWQTRSTPATACAALAFVMVALAHRPHLQPKPAPPHAA